MDKKDDQYYTGLYSIICLEQCNPKNPIFKNLYIQPQQPQAHPTAQANSSGLTTLALSHM